MFKLKGTRMWFISYVHITINHGINSLAKDISEYIENKLLETILSNMVNSFY